MMVATILQNISSLHIGVYDLMASITGIANLKFIGFDDSKSKPVLPKVAMQVSCDGFEVDRGRVMHDVQEFTSDPQTLSYEGEEFEVQTDYIQKNTLPIDIFYSIDTWCHDSQIALNIDLALMRFFPERGVLQISIEDNSFDFPIELLGIQNLDDLAQNIREKVYRYKVEAWIPGFIDDRTGKIITTAISEVYKQINTVNNEEEREASLDEVVLQPDI